MNIFLRIIIAPFVLIAIAIAAKKSTKYKAVCSMPLQPFADDASNNYFIHGLQ
jgi:hypothetical protein